MIIGDENKLCSIRCTCVLLDFKSSCVIKNRRKASNIKVLKFIDQNSALGCFSDKSLTEKQQQGNISQSIYTYVSTTCIIFSLAARTVQRSSNILLPLFPWVLGTECSHSVYFFVFYVFVASSNCPSVVFLCSQGYLHTHHSTMYQKTHQLQLIALYSQQAL